MSCSFKIWEVTYQVVLFTSMPHRGSVAYFLTLSLCSKDRLVGSPLSKPSVCMHPIYLTILTAFFRSSHLLARQFSSFLVLVACWGLNCAGPTPGCQMLMPDFTHSSIHSHSRVSLSLLVKSWREDLLHKALLS